MSSARYRSKTVAAWAALLLGTLGLHRFYLHGPGDKLAWLHPAPTLLGLYGLQRMDQLGQDDRLSWLLMPLLGLMLAITMGHAIFYGLTSDERWNARYNAAGGKSGAPSGWGAVIAAVLGLLLGGTALMATIAFSAQRYFEATAETVAWRR